MAEVTTTAGELRAGDSVRFPDGEGGYRWAPVCRTTGTVDVEVLFAIGNDAEYRTFPADRPVVRLSRRGEAA